MDADRESNAPRPEISAHVSSCVIRARELHPSMTLYLDVFSCHGAVRETDMALLVAPKGFHIFSHPLAAPSRGQHRRGPVPAVGHRAEFDLQEFAQRLRANDPTVVSHTENGVTVIEGVDPDGGRVIIGYPSPFQLPRTVTAARLRA